MKGKMIVIYGINNLGKTLQAKKLVGYLIRLGIPAEYLKYPIYNLKPSGPMIDDYLRGENRHNLSVREVQQVYVQNRTQYEPVLLEKLNSGIWIVSECYIGTGLAWGGSENLDFLVEINSGLYSEDLTIFLNGNRFLEGVEEKHRNENNKKGVLEAKDIFTQLAKQYNWKEVKANQSIGKVHKEILSIVEFEFSDCFKTKSS